MISVLLSYGSDAECVYCLQTQVSFSFYFQGDHKNNDGAFRIGILSAEALKCN